MSKEDELMKTMKDTYYEVRMGTAMMILIIIINILLLSLLGIGWLMWLDSSSRMQ
jgi:hypothetical protein